MNLLHKRKMSQTARVLQMLKKAPYGVYNHELAKQALCYTKVISNLRKDGHVILAIRVDGSGYKYYLNDKENK